MPRIRKFVVGHWGWTGGSPDRAQKADPRTETNPGESVADGKSGLVWHDPVRRG